MRAKNGEAQCFVEGPNIEYTPNPSSSISLGGQQFVKVYINICETSLANNTVTDGEIETLMAEVNNDFDGANIDFIHCIERHFNPDFSSDEAVGPQEILSFINHTDGIDVFIMPFNYYLTQNGAPGCPTLGGGSAYNANTLPPSTGAVAAQEVFLFGHTDPVEFPNPFFPPFVRFFQVPHALSHELGHCLGLFHPSETFFCLEPPTGGDCVNCGDRICDTNPSDDLGFCVSDNCERISHLFPGPCGGQYNPDLSFNPQLDNIMAYTNYYACNPGFTPGQNTRMMETLQNNPLLQNFRVTVFNQDVVISGPNVIWPQIGFPPSGNAIINGNLIINPGAKLTINNGVIQFPENGNVIIHPNGRLNLFATLTATCQHWQGVDVLGTAGASQSFATHGALVAGANSKIEKAFVGANAFNGGIIQCDGTTFLNNYNGVTLLPYSYGQGLSSLKNCNFRTNIFDNFNPQGDLNPKSHVRLLGVKSGSQNNPDFIVSKCNFSNSFQPWILFHPTVYGIWATYSDFVVENGCEFDNFYQGITAIMTNQLKVNISNSHFERCNFGILGTYLQDFDVEGNSFTMGVFPNPIEPPFVFPFQLGTYALGSPDILLRYNGFEETPASLGANTIGSFARDIGTINNSFEKNDYSDLWFGNVAVGNNGNAFSGLHYLCNDNTGTQGMDFGVSASSTIRLNQGYVNPNIVGYSNAGNTFSYSNGNNGDFSDFNNTGNQSIRYFYDPLTPNHEPLDFLNLFVFPEQTPNSGRCVGKEREICVEPCLSFSEIQQLKSGYFANNTAFENARSLRDQAILQGDSALVIQKEYEMALLRDTLDFAVKQILRQEAYGEKNLDTIRKWLMLFNHPNTDIFAAFNLYNNEKYTEADNILSNLFTKYPLLPEEVEEVNGVLSIMDALMQKDISALDSATLGFLVPFSEKENGFDAFWAKSLLSHYGYFFPITLELPEIPGERSKAKARTNSKIKIFPNPASESLHILLDGSEGFGEIKIFDLIGRTLSKISINPTDQIKNMDLSNLPSGLYIVHVERDGKINLTKKFFKK